MVLYVLLVLCSTSLQAQTLGDRILQCVNDTKDALDCALEIAPLDVQKSVELNVKKTIERVRRYDVEYELTAQTKLLFLIPAVYQVLATEFTLVAKHTRGEKRVHLEMIARTSHEFAVTAEVLAESSVTSKKLMKKLHTLSTPQEVRKELRLFAEDRLERTTLAQTLFRKAVFARTIAQFPNTCRDEHSCDSVLDDLISDKLLHWSVSLEETAHVLHRTATNDLKALIRIRELP